MAVPAARRVAAVTGATPGELLVIGAVGCAVFALAALAQAVSGFGSALVSVPLLGLVIGPGQAVVAATAVSLVLTAMGWRREAAYVDRAAARRLVLAGVVGMPPGLLVLVVLDAQALSVVIGVVLLVAVALLSCAVQLPDRAQVHWGAGVASGALLTATGINGPPLVLSLQAAALPPRGFRATLQAVFCCQGVVAVAAFVALGHVGRPALVAAACGCLGLRFGWAVGDRVFYRLAPQTFRQVVLAGLVLTAVAALGSNLV